MNTLAGKTILITGGTGFIGSHIVEKLIQKQVRVVIPYRSIDPHAYFSLQKLHEQVIMIAADIVDHDRVFDMLINYQISHVIHLAAQSNVPPAYHNPLQTIRDNVMGSASVLEACRRASVQGIIFASSDKAYGKKMSATVEHMALAGDHPYEVSKAFPDALAHAYFRTYGTPIAILRAGNLYGPGDRNVSRLIPSIMRSIFLNETLVLRSDGTFVRDYVYVEDVADAYILLLQQIAEQKGEAFNVSNHNTASVRDIIEELEKISGKKIAIEYANSAKNEIPYQELNSDKIGSLGWKGKTSLSSGLKKTYTWYKKYQSSMFSQHK